MWLLLLDIRQGKSVQFMAPPNLNIVDKTVMRVEFHEEDEEGFIEEVLARFPDPANTVVCVLDNCFDDNSLKVAELLFNNDFKEAYAIKGGLRGTEGCQVVQENYLPPSVHVFLRKKKSKKLGHADVNTAESEGQHEGSGEPVAPNNSCVVHTSNESEDGHENPNGSISAVKHSTTRPLSPLFFQHRT